MIPYSSSTTTTTDSLTSPGQEVENLNSTSSTHIVWSPFDRLEPAAAAVRPRRGSLRIFTFKLDAFTFLREAMRFHRFTFKLEFRVYVYREEQMMMRRSSVSPYSIKY
jgi:hypothetical protein